MLSVRWDERALPLAWRVAQTEGAIGFATQQELLEVAAGWLSVGQAVILLADRFYGTPEMICWYCDRGWDYRLRLKGNLVAHLGAIRTTTGALALSGGHYFEKALIGFRGVEVGSCDQGSDEGSEQGFAASPRVVHELEEAEIERQLVLRDAAVRAQP